MLKKTISFFLLAFVIFSIGFAVGKELAVRNSGNSLLLSEAKDEVVIVYYLRSTFRCWQCNMIEVNTEELLHREYRQELDTKRMEWVVVDYLQHRELANRYNISGNTVVVSRHQDGREISFQKLDEVMEKVFNTDEFMSYIRDAVQRELNGQPL